MKLAPFKTFITEGLIKLPPAARKELHDGIARSLAMYAYWHSIGEVQKKAAEVLKSLGVTPLKTLRGNKTFVFNVPISLEDIPATYKGRATKLPKKVTAKVTIAPLLHPDDHTEIGGLYEPDKLRLSIGAKQFADLVVKANDPYEFEAEIERSFNTADHELSHFIQDRVVKGWGEGVEFDPQIKTEIGTFKRLVKHNAGLGVKNDRRALEVFVGNRGEDAFWGSITPATFFLRLKQNDEARWRKAVKLFTQNLNEAVEDKIDPAVTKSFRSLVMHMTRKVHGVTLKPDGPRAFQSSGVHKLRIALDPITNKAIVTRTLNLDAVDAHEEPEFMEMQWMTKHIKEWAGHREIFKDQLGQTPEGTYEDRWTIQLP